MDLQLCRICCLNRGMKSIFISDGKSKMSAKIMYFCVNVKITEGDGLPDHICSVCEVDLNYCYQFVQKCEASEKLLRSEVANSVKSDDNCFFKKECFPDPGHESLLETECLTLTEEENIIKEESLETYDVDYYEDHNVNELEATNRKQKTEIKIPKTELLSTNTVKSYKRKKIIKPGNTFLCTICSHVCKNNSTLNIHLRSHNGEKPFTCPNCDKKYKDRGNLKRHVERKHLQLRERKFICESCGKGFYSKTEITIHMRTHTGETPYACPHCPKKFNQRSSLIRHEIRHSGVKQFSCPKCTKSFSTKDSLKTHLHVHTTEKKYSCNICNALFKYRNNLRKHCQSHLERNSFVCNYCGRTFSAKGNLKTHIDSQHSEKSGQCGVCQKNVSNLEVHMRKHTGERPLKCEFCSGTFFEQNGLAHHINFRHKNTNKHKCLHEGCGDTFPSQPMLEFHNAKQHGTHIPFPCDRCSRGFYRKNDLARHKIGTHKERLK